MSKKVAAIGLAAGITLGLGGAAFAYFTASGNGTGNATVGSNGSWTVAATSSTGTIYPGAGSSLIKYSVQNSSNGEAQFNTEVATVVASTATGFVGDITENGTPHAGCLASWFNATVSAHAGAGSNITAGTTVPDAAEVTVTMPSDSLDIQNNCINATPDINLAVS